MRASKTQPDTYIHLYPRKIHVLAIWLQHLFFKTHAGHSVCSPCKKYSCCCVEWSLEMSMERALIIITVCKKPCGNPNHRDCNNKFTWNKSALHSMNELASNYHLKMNPKQNKQLLTIIVQSKKQPEIPAQKSCCDIITATCLYT